MTTDPNRAIGEAVRRLRERAGWTQKELAQKVGFEHHQIVSTIERGERAVKAAELLQLARTFRVDATDLLRGITPEREPFVLWRAEPIGSSLQGTEALFLQRCRRYALVERLAEVAEDVALPEFPISPRTGNFEMVEATAEQVRGLLQLGNIPGPTLRSALENTWRIKIFRELLDNGSAATTLGEFGPAILENAAEPPKRRVFSLAHELFHVLTWKTVSTLTEEEKRAIHSNNEKLANAFASALLLPRGPVLEAISQRRAETLVDFLPVAQTFNVSLPALLWRLVNLRVLDRRSVEGFLDPDRWWGTTDPGWSPPREIERPFPSRYVSLAFSVYLKGRLTIGRLAELLETTVGMVEKRLAAYGLDLEADAYQAEVLPA
ncbi:MAG: ImmA/IrrE family metallo-endopeptidase [Acidobacteria bacterium]|nr:ImmA/IrrE family metallo-endopeptidase [Acidobacteriota bacterium]